MGCKRARRSGGRLTGDGTWELLNTMTSCIMHGTCIVCTRSRRDNRKMDIACHRNPTLAWPGAERKIFFPPASGDQRHTSLPTRTIASFPIHSPAFSKDEGQRAHRYRPLYTPVPVRLYANHPPQRSSPPTSSSSPTARTTCPPTTHGCKTRPSAPPRPRSRSRSMRSTRCSAAGARTATS